MDLPRREIITGLISLAVTAPAIVRAASIMPVRVIRPTLFRTNWTIVAVQVGGRYNGEGFVTVAHQGDDIGTHTIHVSGINGVIRVGDIISVDDSGRAYA
jgi:hypothetical protein